jgi:hypothetical protein
MGYPGATGQTEKEGSMKAVWRDVVLSVIFTGAVASGVWAQSPISDKPVGSGISNSGSVPDFTGFWAHPFLGFESPASGPGPVQNKSRLRSGQSTSGFYVGDYTNPILKPEAAAIVKRLGDTALAGKAFPDPDSQCLSQPVPYIFWNFEIEVLQQPDKITILYHHDHDFRQVRLNQPHPEHVTPTLHGDSVGHFEGDTLVIDTIGIKPGRFTTLDRFGTPYTDALHVVERYKLLDYEAAKAAQERAEKEWVYIGNYQVDQNYRGKGLQLEFTVEDPNVFTTPWSAIISYRRAARPIWEEYICAENISGFYGDIQYFSDKDAAVPTAEKPDF